MSDCITYNINIFVQFKIFSCDLYSLIVNTVSVSSKQMSNTEIFHKIVYMHIGTFHVTGV